MMNVGIGSTGFRQSRSWSFIAPLMVVAWLFLGGTAQASIGTMSVTPNCAGPNAQVDAEGWTPGVFYDTALLDASGQIVFYSGFTGPTQTGLFGFPGTGTFSYVIYAGSASIPYDPNTRMVLAKVTWTCTPSGGAERLAVTPNCAGPNAQVDAEGFAPGVFYNTALVSASNQIVFYSGFTGPTQTGGFGFPGGGTFGYVIYAGSAPIPYDPNTRTVLAAVFWTCPRPLATSLALSPIAGVGAVGTSATFTATARDSSNQPLPNVTVRFSVNGSVTTAGSCVTGVGGQCSFSYAGPQLPGADAVTSYADNNQNGTADNGEPTAEATQAWVLPSSTSGQTTGGGQIPNGSGQSTIAFGFTAKSDTSGPKGECSVVDISPLTNIKVKCSDVTSLIQSGNRTTFFGDAEVNGTATTYRIDVQDNAEPGTGSDTFKIQTASGYSASGTLTGGNVQVHN